MIATYPVGGVAWDYGQYAAGLTDLGFEVYYLEDTGGQTYDPEKRIYGDDCSYGIRFLSESLARLSPQLADRWHFRAANGDCYGIAARELNDLMRTADVLLNVSGSSLVRDAYLECPCKVLIDTDPGWNHFVNFPRWDANPGWQGTHGYRAHDHFFTYAERIGKKDCMLPEHGLSWQPTRPPVILDQWHASGQGHAWTTVMTWDNFRRPVEYAGRVFGTKEKEFGKIESVPAHLASLKFELATGGSGAPVERWREIGWNVVDSHAVSTTMDEYRQYIQTSRGELSVAKNLYVATLSGWFSCRSACYLAAGRPVIVQDTGFSEVVPTGEGLFAFSDGREAEQALAAVESDYARHSRAAREVAAECFNAGRVVGSLLQRVGLK